MPYILNAGNALPRYVVILFPGGSGRVEPRMQDGTLVYGFKGNFLLRARPTMALAGYLSERIAGEIHTSSHSEIYGFDTRTCRSTPFFAAEAAHERYGTDLIAMDGGISVGGPCEAFAHHGYNGIERETAAAIKKWIKQGG